VVEIKNKIKINFLSAQLTTFWTVTKDVRYFPKGIFPSGNFPWVFFQGQLSKCANSQAVTAKVFLVAAIGPLSCSNRSARLLLQPTATQKASY